MCMILNLRQLKYMNLPPSFRQLSAIFKVANQTVYVRIKRLILLEIHLVGCSIIKCLMKPLLIVKVEIVSQPTPSSVQRVIVVEIYLLILNTSPQPLNEDVIQIAASAVPADSNVSRLESIGKGIRSKLTALVVVEYHRS